jgi:hypothetical protein
MYQDRRLDCGAVLITCNLFGVGGLETGERVLSVSINNALSLNHSDFGQVLLAGLTVYRRYQGNEEEIVLMFLTKNVHDRVRVEAESDWVVVRRAQAQLHKRRNH